MRRHDGLRPEWRIESEHHLERDFHLCNFRDALDFAYRVGELSEALGHHPEILIAWANIRLTLWTHKSNGLTHEDFVLAGAIDRLSEHSQGRA